MKHLIQTQFIYKLDEDSELKDGLIELINEAEEHGYWYKHILRTKDKDYIFSQTIMNLKEIDWSKEKALEYLLSL